MMDRVGLIRLERLELSVEGTVRMEVALSGFWMDGLSEVARLMWSGIPVRVTSIVGFATEVTVMGIRCGSSR